MVTHVTVAVVSGTSVPCTVVRGPNCALNVPWNVGPGDGSGFGAEHDANTRHAAIAAAQPVAVIVTTTRPRARTR